ncbi:MAG: NAD(P)-dependent dehydrogenase (short-subunit alcohol dehydrogenase family) [Cyclobacteriaceae bacterium]|jgi:NAD(P)-dependent dehydrogenase (short-subunit alcohol dehydrogenase family)
MTDTFGYRTTALEAIEGIDLTGKSAIVTGGYSGIGLETARALIAAGAEVTLACRDLPRAKTVAAEIGASAMRLDLGSLESVKEFALAYNAHHTALHILINNAAVMACPQDTTLDGFEMQFGTNQLGHYALTRLLLPSLKQAEGARVVCLSSTGHFLSPVMFDDIEFAHRAYDPWLSYGQAKTANSLTAVAIQQLFQANAIEAFAVHPGGIMTSLQRHMTTEDIQTRGWVDSEGNVNERFKTVEEGASTSVWAATCPQLIDLGGCYLEDCGIAKVHDIRPQAPTGVMNYAVDPVQAMDLWHLSETMIDGKFPGYFR